MFVVTLPASERDPEAYARRAQELGAGMLEIRGDLSPDRMTFACCLPILATPRGKDAAWIEGLRPRYVDLDVSESVAVPAGVELIRSHHDFKLTPRGDAMQGIIERLSSSGADRVKLATTICDYDDIVVLEAVRERLPEGAIVLGMGEKAHLQRLLSVSRNAWTYTCTELGSAAAPGQIDIETHLVSAQVEQPKIYGVLGGPGLQSLGPKTHGAWFREKGVQAIYSQFPCRDFEAGFRQLVALGVQGFSVTSPHKVAAFEIADDCDDLCKELGAANTLIRDGSKWIAHMTDVDGFVRGYPQLRGLQSARIIGAGGVAPAVISACRDLGVETVEVWARREDQALELCRRFGVTVVQRSDGGSVDAVINTIPNDVDVLLPSPNAGGIAVDLRYGDVTPFLRRATSLGYLTMDGISMFEHQARAQFRLFTGIDLHGEQ